MIRITNEGKLVDATELIPKFTHICDVNKVDIDKPVSFVWCGSTLVPLLDLLKGESRENKIIGKGMNALLNLDEQIVAKANNSKFTLIYPVQNLIDFHNKNELQNLYGIALCWNWVTGSNYIFILKK
jgi:hypothetical protein